MAADEKWYFTKEQLANTPSRKCGYEVDKELSYRQQAANLIQDMGQRLQVTQLCINTAIVYMHRFYVFHSFAQFHRNSMAAAALFLAAKVEEQPRKLEHVIKVAHMCLNRDQPSLDTKSEKYLEQAQELVFNENVLLQTLGFDVAIDHPHTHVVRCCHLVRASKDLAQTSYFMASNSLHLTTMCLQYKPTVVACFCIHLACKWSNWEIPQSNEGKDWFWYVDKTVTLEQLEQLTAEFLVIFDKCPTKLKRKIMSISATQNPTLPPAISGSLFDMEPRKIRPPDGSQDGMPFHPGMITAGGRPPPHHTSHVPGDSSKPPADGEAFKKLHQISSSLPGASGPPQQVVQQAPRDYREYKEKKERERLAQQAGVARDGHHGAPHLNKSVPGGSSKHHQPAMPPGGGAGILPKPGPPHHKHPPPMSSSSTRPGSGVSQARDAVRREQAFAREAAKRDSGQRGGEHMFAPPIRHHEPKENTPLLQALGEHLQHHGLTMDPTPSMGNHIGSGINSGINCNVNSRKDNHEWTGSESIGDVDVRHGIDKSNVLSSRGGEAKSTENRNLVPVHVDPAKRSHQQGFESLSRHGRVPSDHRSSGGDVRNVKEEVSSNPPTSDTQRHLYNHNKHGASSDRLDHGRHRRPGVSEQFPSRPTAEGERKPNISDLVDRKPNIQDLGDRKPDLVDRKSNVTDVDRKSSASDVDRKPNVTDIVDRKPNISDLPDRKPNIADLHSSFSENRHESSGRRSGGSDASKHQPAQSHHPVKKEPKLEPGIPKKDEVTDAVTKSAISTARPPPPSHPPPQSLLQHPQQPPALSSSQQPATLLPTLPSHHHQEKHKSRSKSPSQAHEKPPPPPPSHQQRSRSPTVPPRVKSPISAGASSNISKRSESPYHGRTKSTPVSHPTLSKTGTAHIQPISEEKSIPEARNRRPETPVTKPLLTSDQSNTTIKLEADAPQHTSLKVSSGSSQKLSATADKAGTPVQRESPYRASKSTRQRTPPSSSSKKHPASLPEIISTPLSPFGSPPPPTPTTPGSATKSSQGSLRTTNRNRTSSSSSEPELVPVVKKLDEIAGYENIIRDSKLGIKLPNRVPDIIPPIRDRSKKDDASSVPLASASSSVTLSVAKELKPPDLIRPFDTLTHVAKPGLPDDLGAVAFPESDSANGTFGRTAIPPASLTADDTIGGSSIQSVGVIDISTMGEQIQPIENVHSVTSSVPEHHHRSEKKKKKKDSKEHREHRDHKHKNKDKNRDEKKHKHKHKEKDKDRHKVEKVEGSAPIKITIPKDKIIGQTLAPSDTSAGIKLKIQKERIKGSDSTGNSPQMTPAAPSGGIKIKISKEVIGNFNSSNASISAPNSETPSSSTSRKRDRSSPRSSELTTPPGPPAKSARLVASGNEQQRRGGSSSSTYGKQNGVEHHRSRGSHYSTPGNKVVQKVADPHNVYQSKGKSSSYTSSGSQP